MKEGEAHFLTRFLKTLINDIKVSCRLQLMVYHEADYSNLIEVLTCLTPLPEKINFLQLNYAS